METSQHSETPAQIPSKEAEQELLLGAVREAGEIALGYFGKSPDVEIKADGTSVSEADLAVNDLLKHRLLGPGGYGWLSEESDDDPARLEAARVWIVDPIDGTRAFLKGKPEWTISVALVDNGQPRLAAVYNPATGEFFRAARGQGAFLNDQPIRVNDPVGLDGCRLAASSSLFRPERWARSWPDMETVWVNSIAYRLALVAAGECDGTLSLSGKNDWDIAAAHLIVEEAGGVVTTRDAKPFVYNRMSTRHGSVAAAGPALHAALIERASQATI